MEIKTTGRLTQTELLQKVKECLQGMGISMIKEVPAQVGKTCEFESNDMTIKIFCRFPNGSPSHVFVEFDLPNIAKKLKETLGG